jgi:hypothetical protein
MVEYKAVNGEAILFFLENLTKKAFILRGPFS